MTVRRRGVTLAILSLWFTALPATAARSAGEASMTIRLISTPGRTAVKDVPPKTLVSGELTKGDTISGTSILRNAAPQFGKAKGAVVGGDSYVMTTASPPKLLIKVQVKLPGGTLRVEGQSALKKVISVPVVGGTASPVVSWRRCVGRGRS